MTAAILKAVRIGVNFKFNTVNVFFSRNIKMYLVLSVCLSESRIIELFEAWDSINPSETFDLDFIFLYLFLNVLLTEYIYYNC